MKLIVSTMIRNEEGRFLDRALGEWRKFADEIVVLDDASEDVSVGICAAHDAHLIKDLRGAPAWGAESPKRARLFEASWAFAAIGDYILVLDADMVPAKDPRIMTETGADAVSFRLFDLWHFEHRRHDCRFWYREDEFWRGHQHPRVWMIRKTSGESRRWEWSPRGIHCGHFPLNLNPATFSYAPRDHSLLHFAYITPELRDEKYVAYASVAGDLTEFERRHAISIRDPNPPIFELEFTPEFSLV